jgi:hypothetical protein
MNVIKLNAEHTGQIQHLFQIPKFREKTNQLYTNSSLSELSLKLFADTYLTDSQNYHAYGVQDVHGNINSVLGFYESIDDPSWYWNLIRTSGNNSNEIKMLLDKAISHNEEKGRFKFYSMFPLEYRKAYRRLAFSNNAKERYDYFDEFQVESNHYPIFTLPWQILYNRTLVPIDSIVRCTFLKQQYRDTLYKAGRL